MVWYAVMVCVVSGCVCAVTGSGRSQCVVVNL